jgi:hypothetical protein
MKCITIRILFVSIGFQLVFLFYIQNVNAAEWYQPDNYQVRAFYGRTAWTTAGEDPHDDGNMSLCAGQSVLSWMEIIVSLGPGYLKSSNFGSAPSAELRLLGQAQYGHFYFELGGGLAYLFDRDNLPDLADSNLYAIISGSVGIEIFHFEGDHHDLYFKTGYRIEHISSPFHSSDDVGVNIGAIEMIFGWNF